MKASHQRHRTLWVPVILLGIFFTMTLNGMAENKLQQFENSGLSFQYPSDLHAMKLASTKQIQEMLNQQLRGMGNTQISVVALDVLLNLPAFRVMIAKERFIKEPTPSYLIEERKHFLDEAQKRGMVKSYGDINEIQVGTYAAIEFRDLDKGAQGYGSRIRVLCGKDTWNFTFSGNSRKSYEQYQGHIPQLLNSVVLPKTC